MNKIDFEQREKLIFLYEKYKNFLTQSQRQVFELYYFEDLSLSEIAKIICTTRQAINDSLLKAKNKLLKIEKDVLD